MAALSQYAIIEADRLLGTDSLVWIDGRWSAASRHAAVIRHAERLARFNGTIATGYSYRGHSVELTDAEQSHLATASQAN